MMRSEAMTFDGRHRAFPQAGYVPTAHPAHMGRALTTAVKPGRLVVLSGLVGCGQTPLWRRLQDDLRREPERRVAQAVA
jgi:hypothetical protein